MKKFLSAFHQGPTPPPAGGTYIRIGEFGAGQNVGSKISLGDGQWYTPEVPKYHLDIQALFFVKGRLWVFTSTTKSDNKILVDIFDRNGVYEENFYIDYPPYAIPFQTRKWIKEINGDFLVWPLFLCFMLRGLFRPVPNSTTSNPPPIFSHRLTQDIPQTKKFNLSVVVCVSLWLNRQSFENSGGEFRTTVTVPNKRILVYNRNSRTYFRGN